MEENWCRLYDDLNRKRTAQLYALPVCSANLCHLPEHTTGAPADAGYVTIFSTAYAFAALRTDGSIRAWGSSWGGGTGKYAYLPAGVCFGVDTYLHRATA